MKRLLFWLCVGVIVMLCLNKYVRGEASIKDQNAEGFCELWNSISISSGFDIRFGFNSNYSLIVKNINSCLCHICIKLKKEMIHELSLKWFEATDSRRVECWSVSGVLVLFVNEDGDVIIACEIF